MSEPILEMKNISKNFGSVIALKNVDLEVYPGDIRGLIGENGSGKSTISSIAAGMQKATSGTDGILRFEDLEVDKKYYLKETKAPDGYQIPVNADGSDIVYEIYTKSDPQKDLFEYYVNGKKYTDATGDFAITGTKADREVNLKVVNPVGMKMPETGSPWTVGILLTGLGLIVAGYVMMIRKGKQEDEEK